MLQTMLQTRIYPRKSTLQPNFTKKVVNFIFIHKLDEKCLACYASIPHI